VAPFEIIRWAAPLEIILRSVGGTFFDLFSIFSIHPNLASTQKNSKPPSHPDHQGAAPIGGWHLFQHLFQSVGGTFFNRWVAPFSICSLIPLGFEALSQLADPP
jgi:hypothetical protein